MSNLSAAAAAAAAAARQGGEKASTFALTCNLLSQFIKEKGRVLGDLGLGMPPTGKPDTYRPPTTMSLLPGVEVDVSGDDSKEGLISNINASKSIDLFPQRSSFGLTPPPAAAAEADSRELGKSPMTIFYGGKVIVFDNFPADKARDLMALAGKGTASAFAPTPPKNTCFAPPTRPSVTTEAPIAKPETKNLNLNSSFVAAQSNPPATVHSCPPKSIVSDLPIARKASLHRFLEKRKDRINAKAPYQVKDSPASNDSPKEENQPWLGLKPSQSSECSR